MRILFYILLILTASLNSLAQKYDPPGNYGIQDQRTRVLRAFHPPLVNIANGVQTNITVPGLFAMDSATKKYWGSTNGTAYNIRLWDDRDTNTVKSLITAGTPTLQQVTTAGKVTTDSIKAAGYQLSHNFLQEAGLGFWRHYFELPIDGYSTRYFATATSDSGDYYIMPGAYPDTRGRIIFGKGQVNALTNNNRFIFGVLGSTEKTLINNQLVIHGGLNTQLGNNIALWVGMDGGSGGANRLMQIGMGYNAKFLPAVILYSESKGAANTKGSFGIATRGQDANVVPITRFWMSDTGTINIGDNDTLDHGKLVYIAKGVSADTLFQRRRMQSAQVDTGCYIAPDGSFKNFALPVQMVVAISDETTTLTTGTAKITFRMPHAMRLTAVRASLTTVSSSGLPTFNIKENGTTVLSTKITIDASEKTSTTAATPPVISDNALADDSEMTVDIDVAGTGATGAKIYLIGTR